MKITIGQPHSIFNTIGYTEKFEPVLYWKIGQRKQALEDLANFFNRFHELLATGIELDEMEYLKFSNQFHDKAMKIAEEVLNRSIEHGMYKNRFFSFLRINTY